MIVFSETTRFITDASRQLPIQMNQNKLPLSRQSPHSASLIIKTEIRGMHFDCWHNKPIDSYKHSSMPISRIGE